jgi:hypothetical protein
MNRHEAASVGAAPDAVRPARMTRRGVPGENIPAIDEAIFPWNEAGLKWSSFIAGADPQRGSIMTTFLLALLSIGIFLAHAIDAIRAPGAKGAGPVLHQNTSTGQNWLRSREML